MPMVSFMLQEDSLANPPILVSTTTAPEKDGATSATHTKWLTLLAADRPCHDGLLGIDMCIM